MVMLRWVRVLMNVRPARQKEAVQDWETEGGAIAEPPRANPTAQAGLNTNHERTGDSSHEQSDCQDPPLAAPRPEAQDLGGRNQLALRHE